MAKLTAIPYVELKASFTMTEPELRAFDALVGYGADGFIKVFYEHMGRAYLEKHEGGLRTLFESMREQLPAFLRRADIARDAFKEKQQLPLYAGQRSRKWI
jgi:hypothetical protein